MARPFDAATKHLIETNPADWLAYVGLPRAERERRRRERQRICGRRRIC